VIRELGNPPNINNLSPELWGEVGKELQGVLQPGLEEIFLASAEAMLDDVVIGADWALINETAAEWAGKHVSDLVVDIVGTKRKIVNRAVEQFYRDGLTVGDLEGRLVRAFGPINANMIASTEITRAAVEGELAVVAELERQGARMQARWQTNFDEDVCQICAPRNKHVRGTNWTEPPPAHVRCRCWLNHEFMEFAS